MTLPDDEALAFSVLGPLTVSRGGAPVDLGTPKARAVLAILLTRPGRAVPVHGLLDALWESTPPKTAVKNIQLYVHQLRRALGDPERIVRETPGYRLVVHPGELDAARFDELVERSRTAGGDAGLLREALGLWRGEEAYAGVSGVAPVDVEARRLGEVRLAAVQDRIDADLREGRSTELLAELVELTGRYPLREGFWVRLMSALYHAGRQTEALRVFERARRLIADETGLDPGQELLRLRSEIVTRPAGASVAPETPRMLPGDLADFTGRTRELAAAAEALRRGRGADRPVRVVAVSGRGGIGKTVFAVRLAHRLGAEYAGGQLYANLHGTQPAEVLGRFLRILGVAGADLPEGVEERATLYRTLLAPAPVLVVLDNVTDESQVLPLLPGNGTSGVIVTSRSRLGGLPGAYGIDLDGLPDDDGCALLRKITGSEGLGDGSGELLRLCAGLPLALRIVGAQLATRPHRTVADLVERLSDERHRLDALRHRDLAVRASLGISYRALEPRAQRLFRLLGLLDTPDFATWTAAAVLDTTAEEARTLLDDVIDARLLESANGRYRFHDLARLYAYERAEAEETPEARTAALSRAFGGWLALTDAAHRAAGDGVYTGGNAPRWRPELAAAAVDPRTSTVELMAESRALLAAVTQSARLGLTEMCWQLALGSVPVFQQGNFLDEWQTACDCAAEACAAAGDRRGQAVVWHLRGLLHGWRRRHAEARPCHERALEIFDELGDRHGSALAVRRLAGAERNAGRPAAAIALSRRAYDLLTELGDPGAAADALIQIGSVQLESGRPDVAVEVLTEAMEQAAACDAMLVRAQGAYWIAAAHTDLGRLDDADRACAVLEDFVRRSGSPRAEVYALYGRGRLDAALGRTECARSRLEAALALAREIRDPLLQVRILYALGRVATGPYAASLHLYEAAEIAQELRIPLWQALSAQALGDLHAERGDRQAARGAWEHALTLFTRIGSPRAADVARLLEDESAHASG